MNPYLAAKRAEYDALKAGIEGLQSRAATENRSLTDDELTSVRSQGEQARKLADEITALTEIEQRHAAVAQLAHRVDTERRDESGTEGDEQTRGTRLSGTATRDRDPGHYRRDGAHSFFSDVYRHRALDDHDARTRLLEHARALTSVDEGPGTTPPVWMASEFTELARQQRRLSAAVRNLPLSSPAPMTLPYQSAGTDAVVVQQTTEETGTTWTDAWDSATVSVSPKATAGGQKVTRHMLESSSPAVDALIFGDLVSAYNTKIEAAVVAAWVTAAGSATVTYATEAAYQDALDDLSLFDAIRQTATAVRTGLKLPADVLVSSVPRYGTLLDAKDATGRPMVPEESAGPMNVFGTGSVAVDGRVRGLGILASDGVTQYPESILVGRASETILFESPVRRLRYEEPDGPEIVRLAIWAYTAIHVKRAASVERIAVTAAA